MPARRKPASQLKRKRDKRPSAAKRGYGYQWQKSRKKSLGKGKKCANCGKSATHRHHTSYNPPRYKWLCTSCHNAHTARNKHKSGKR